MKSEAVPSFWKTYAKLTPDVQERAQKAYYLWIQNAFHPSLRFKCINHAENIWSVRITLGIRALGVLDDDTVTWFWIGNHDDYRRYFG